MNVLAHGWYLGHRGQHSSREIGGIGRCEAHAANLRHRADGAEQVGKVVVAIVIAVDRLPKKRDLASAGLHQPGDLTHDVCQLAAPLRPARHRNNAEGAPIIAATLHRHERGHLLFTHRRHVFVVLPAPKRGFGGALALARARNQLRQTAITVGADHQVYLRHAFEQLRTQPLGHTTHHAQDISRTLVALQLPHASQHALFRVIAHRAGIDQQYVRFGRIVGAHVSLTSQHSEHQLGIRNVHLAAVGLDINARRAGHQSITTSNRGRPLHSSLRT